MSEKSLQENIVAHLSSIELCLQHHYRMPALILIYSGIDIFSSLALPIEKEDGTRQDFINWAEKYITGVENFGCDAIDLYAARCGVVHANTATSSLSRKNQAKIILYAWGNRTPESLQTLVDTVGIENVVVIHIDLLATAFKKGVAKFVDDIRCDQVIAERVFRRAGNMFMNQSWKL